MGIKSLGVEGVGFWERGGCVSGRRLLTKRQASRALTAHSSYLSRRSGEQNRGFRFGEDRKGRGSGFGGAEGWVRRGVPSGFGFLATMAVFAHATRLVSDIIAESVIWCRLGRLLVCCVLMSPQARYT